MAFQYELSFVGIPFVSDKGIAIRMGQKGNPFVENDLQTPRKHQVLSTLYDEINRIIPIELFQEYTPYKPSSYVDSLSTPPMQPMEVRLGEFFYPHSMSRWSVFRGLATTSIVNSMLAVTAGNAPAEFIMKSVPLSPDNPSGTDPNDTWKISTNMYMLPPRCLAEHGGQFDGLYLITLVDDRYFTSSTLTSLNITSLQTWEAVISQLSLDLGFNVSLYSSISSVYGRPEPDSQLWVAGSQEAASLLDCVAMNVGRSVVRNYDGNFVLYTPAESYALTLDNRGSDNPVRVAGGDFYALSGSRNAALPTEINVTFPKYIVGNDPVPHFYNPRYTSPRPTAWVEDSYGAAYTVTTPIQSAGTFTSGVTGISQWTIESVSKALYATESAAGGSPTNQTQLAALSTQLAADRAAFQTYAFLDEVYTGTYAWEPEGLHDITWTYSERKGLATTRVTRYPWDEVMSKTSQHATFAADGGFVISGGVGGKSVAQTWRDQLSGVGYGVNLVTLGSSFQMTDGVLNNGIKEINVQLASGGIGSGLIGSGVINNYNIGSGAVYWYNLGSGCIRSGHITPYALPICAIDAVTNVCAFTSGATSGVVTGIKVEYTRINFYAPFCPTYSGAIVCVTNPINCCSGTISSGTIATDCCPSNLLSITMYVTFTSPDCVCWNYGIVLTWNGVDRWQSAPYTDPCSNVEQTLYFLCNSGGVWELAYIVGSPDPCFPNIPAFGTPTSTSCNPFVVEYSVVVSPDAGTCNCPSGTTVTITVTT